MKISARLVLLLVLGGSFSFVACNDDGGVGEGEFENGYYIDHLVSGVTYSTKGNGGATLEGKTGEDNDPGLFKYLDGEMVAFSLGDTDLGEVIGKPRVSPFDLAGVEETAVGGCDADGELPDDDFRIVHNMAVLLQTFDDDGEPSNGIVISAAVASLFENVSINLDQAKGSFVVDPELLKVLGEANDNDLFSGSVPRAVREGVSALQGLYKGLELCP